MWLIPVIAITAVAILIVCYAAIKLMQLDFQRLILVTLGFIFGAGGGVLISLPLNRLPEPYGGILPIVVTMMSALALGEVFYQQHTFINSLFPKVLVKEPSKKTTKPDPRKHYILVDTSAIIDGRIADIAKTGFISDRLWIPRFILAELQNIADSNDPLRRSKGRRGLEMLKSLQDNKAVEVEIIEDDSERVKEVDAKLVHLAKKLKASILTTDFNLNRVAAIEKVRVLNVNELSQALRAVVLPGEIMEVKVVQVGKEKHQGLGYLEDGTMIVVEGGDKLVGKVVKTEVTRIFQTVAGKMIFVTPRVRK